ncbi:MAG: sugar phosphate isomerase/epimerase [Oscillospiraceae bacterium]|nr:sugar phosphate isomerase/epimerase [Oscillospiraceae bacterium]
MLTFPPEEMVDAFLSAGYTASEFSDEHGFVMLARAKERGVSPRVVGAELKAYADERGFSFPQGHLFHDVDLCADDAVEVLTQWLDLFLGLGVRSAVLHAGGGKGLTFENRYDRWIKVLTALTGHLKGTDMSIALENLKDTTDVDMLNKIIDTVGDENLGICLDTGHLHLTTDRGLTTQSQGEFIRRAGKRLIALHVADNDLSSDLHILPFGRGNIDWWDFASALREVGYDRLFNYEIPGERLASPKVRMAKLKYIKTVTEELLSDEFFERGKVTR